MQYPVISRNDAFKEGKSHFFTGKPCVRGHVAKRFVSTGGCVACNRERASRYTSGQPIEFKRVLHPDDHAAAEAYCQALDMQRSLTVAAEVRATRSAAAQAIQSTPQLFMPKP